MRNPRIFQPIDLNPQQQFELDTAGSHHVGKVLRMQPGEPLIIFNGQGGQYQAEIIAVTKKAVSVALQEWQANNNASNFRIHLGQVVSRGERMDFAIQKAVELGVSEITPVFSQRAEVKLSGVRLEKRLQQWRQQIISACEQCGLNLIPRLNPACDLKTFLAQQHQGFKWLLHPGEQSISAAVDSITPKSATLAIGPEGGFTDAEIEMAEQQGFIRAAIGPRVLRTETAPVAAISLLQRQWGDFF